VDVEYKKAMEIFPMGAKIEMRGLPKIWQG